MIYGSVQREHLADIFHDGWAGEMIYSLSARQEWVIGIVAVLFLLSVLCTRKQNQVFLALYGAGMIYITLLSRFPGARRIILTPFWSYRHLADSPYFQRQVANNILLFS